MFCFATGTGTRYRYYPTDTSKYSPVLFPFGWGQTYSNFSITLESGPSSPDVPIRLRQGELVQHTVRVENIGPMDSDEVIQVGSSECHAFRF